MRITPKLFTGLALAAGVSLVAAAAVYTSTHQWSAGDVSGSALFPELDTRANDVATFELRQGDKTLTIEYGKTGWVASSAGGYPVRPGRIRSVIIKLIQAELIEPKTRNPKRYALLDLGDPSGKGAKARQIRLLGRDGKPIAEAVIGAKRWDAFGSGKSGTYVRRPGDPQTWLASLDIDAKPEIKGWVEDSIFSIDSGKITSLTVTHEGEEPLKISRIEGQKGKFRLDGIPEDAKLKKSGPTAAGVAKSFAAIQLENLRKLKAAPAGSDNATAELETGDGLKVTFHLHKEKKEDWLSLSATGDGEAAKRADEINARVKGWEYNIPAYKADNMFRSRSEFFETS